MPRKLRVLTLAAVLLSGISVLAAHQQQPPQGGATFKSGTRTVPLYATVVDGTGRLVPDLQRDEFEILDNGVVTPITLFANEIQKITVVVMLDTSGSMTFQMDNLKEGAEQFALRLLPGDQARIGSFSDKIIITPPMFTGNRDELIRAIHNDIQYGNPTALWDAADRSMDVMQGLEGRRVVLLFTDGEDNYSRKGLKDVQTRALNEEFMIYGIGLRGTPGGGITQRPDGGLRKIAEETGGGYFELKGTTDLNSTFTRVANELHSQYVLGFTPEKLDGKLHKIEIRVKQPGLKARTRKSYIATP
ncbi:MAG: VWA domain-containing protein [Acidobacteria bacterium]|nr:VWA domain-containing protein [Acidobacteriota bacterium]